MNGLVSSEICSFQTFNFTFRRQPGHRETGRDGVGRCQREPRSRSQGETNTGRTERRRSRSHILGGSRRSSSSAIHGEQPPKGLCWLLCGRILLLPSSVASTQRCCSSGERTHPVGAWLVTRHRHPVPHEQPKPPTSVTTSEPPSLLLHPKRSWDPPAMQKVLRADPGEQHHRDAQPR